MKPFFGLSVVKMGKAEEKKAGEKGGREREKKVEICGYLLKSFTQVKVSKYKFYFGIWNNSCFPTWILRNVTLITAIEIQFLCVK